MNKVLCGFLSLAASAIMACDTPPPPDTDSDNAVEATENPVVSDVRSQARSETVVTSQGVTIRFTDGSYEARMPPGFDEPGFDSIPQQHIVINRHISRSGNRLAMVGWNDHEEGFFENVVLDSFLNVAKYTTLRQMEGELLGEERFSYRGYPGIRFVIRYEDVDREAATPDADAEGDDDSEQEAFRERISIYSRYDFLIGPPRLYQMVYSTPDETELESEAIQAFFDSFRLDIEPYDPNKYD